MSSVEMITVADMQPTAMARDPSALTPIINQTKLSAVASLSALWGLVVFISFLFENVIFHI